MQLRKLTHLSKIEFGNHAGKTVEQILNTPSGKSYMQWLYFNASHINLCDDLMDELQITHQLVKPGKDPEIFQEFYYDGFKYKRKDQLGASHLKPSLETKFRLRYTREKLQCFNQNRHRA